jgi:hypothetical protein
MQYFLFLLKLVLKMMEYSQPTYLYSQNIFITLTLILKHFYYPKYVKSLALLPCLPHCKNQLFA